MGVHGITPRPPHGAAKAREIPRWMQRDGRSLRQERGLLLSVLPCLWQQHPSLVLAPLGPRVAQWVVKRLKSTKEQARADLEAAVLW